MKEPLQTPGDRMFLVADAVLMRHSLKKFVMGAWSIIEPASYIDGWCIDAICEHLEALSRRQIRFLLINIPPRHSKSTICSVIWPAWTWLQNPSERFLCASYSLSLAIRDNHKKCNLLESSWFQSRYGQDFTIYTDTMQLMHKADFRMSESHHARRFFVNDKLGYQLAVSVGSTTTGEGGSFLLIDDAHAASEAHSDAERETALTWFRETWSSRMNNPSQDCMLVIGQRIHEYDVSGLILAERPDWTHLNLPAEYEPARKCHTSIGWSDPREIPGELLWPERFDTTILARYKRDLGSIGFAAQYQQVPVPASGGTFKREWVRYFVETDQLYMLEKATGTTSCPKSQCWRFATMDLAISSRQSADYTVLQIYDVTPSNDLLLIHQVRGHMDNPEQQKLIRSIYVQWRPLFFKIESTGYQLALIQQLRDAPIRPGDFLVEVGNPAALDNTLKQMGWIGAYVLCDVQGNFSQIDGYAVVRVEGDARYFQYAMEKQGYCRIVRQLDASSTHALSIPVREYRPTRDKVARASVAAIQMENEKILLKKGADYLNDLLHEILMFPRGSHDDQVDAISSACDELTFPSDYGPIPIAFSGGEQSDLPAQYDEDMSDQMMERQQKMMNLIERLQGFLA